MDKKCYGIGERFYENYYCARIQYEGSLSAIEVAEAIEFGMKRICPRAEFIKMPIADGGEGTLDTLVYATGGTFEVEKVLSPLGGRNRGKMGHL